MSDVFMHALISLIVCVCVCTAPFQQYFVCDNEHKPIASSDWFVQEV